MGFFYITEDALGERVGHEDTVVIAVGGEVDYAASPQLRDSISAQIQGGRHHVVLDMSDATFIDSTAIGVLAGAADRLRQSGAGSLSLVCADENNRVLRIFDITGLDSLIACHPSREDALSALVTAG